MRTLIILLTLGSFQILNAQTLDASIRTAIENSPAIKARRAAFEASLQKLPQVGSLPDPEVSLSFFVGQMMLPMGNQLGNLTVMQMFPWFGVLDAQRDAAAGMSEVAYQEIAMTGNELALKVKNAWYPLAAQAEKIRLQKEILEVLKADKDLALVKFQHGQVPMADPLRVDLMMEEVKTEIAVLELERKPLITAFNAALFRPLDTPVSPEQKLDWNLLSPIERPDSTWAQNPALKTIDSEVEASRAREVVASKMRLPSIATGITYMPLVKRYSHIHLEPNTGADMVMPMISVSVPIWHKKYAAAMEEEKWNQVYWQEMKRETTNNLSADYENAYFEWEKALKINDLMDIQIKNVQQLIDLSLAAYGNGNVDLESVLLLQQQKLRYQREKVDTFIKGGLSVAQMEWLIGKQ